MMSQSSNPGIISRDQTGDEISGDTERTPLYQRIDRSETASTTAYSSYLVVLCILLILVVTTGSTLMMSPVNQIIEHIICDDYSKYSASGSRCKALDVQRSLAEIRGWSNALAVLPAFLVSIPYGILADRVGRRPILCLSMVGISLSSIQQIIICRIPDSPTPEQQY
jgi:MFS family permease